MILNRTRISRYAPPRAHRFALCAAIVAIGLSAPAPAQAPELAMLSQLKTGNWSIKNRGEDGIIDRICVRNPADFVQIRHRGLQCSRLVIEDTARRITVQYSCRGAGNGRTTIRRETNSLVQINTQGIERNAPFSLSLEARHIGPCG